MFITGVCNNPFTLMAQQLGLTMRLVNEDRCDLVTERGGKVEAVADEKVERHFNQSLDLLSDWRSSRKAGDVAMESEFS